MDQNELYEQQLRDGCGTGEPAAALVGRDRFVVSTLRQLFADAQVRIGELSIGTGHLTSVITSEIGSVSLDCYDISRSRLEHVAERIRRLGHGVDPSRVSFHQCNFDVDFDRVDSLKYDVVIALDIMEHVLDVFGFMDNCFRVLKPGGWLLLRVPNIAYVTHRVTLLGGGLPVTASWFGREGDLGAWRAVHGWDGGHLHLFTIPIVTNLLTCAGFELSSCSDPGTRFEKYRKLWPALLFSNPLFVARKASA